MDTTTIVVIVISVLGTFGGLGAVIYGIYTDDRYRKYHKH